ncbi:hypothetical protein [Chthonobacter albigriseus]|uniref:hypothetical protein n=1 Tax=Chthonobacter albigriseus TaxID=1683161 RepID=UPI0015EFCD4B|nr:hypothetical protein [Chthonobacter albigriseus]
MTAVLLSTLAPAAAQDRTAFAEVDKLTETLGEKVQIAGGGVVIGFFATGEPVEERPRAEAVIPAAWKGSWLCVALVSADGRYERSQSLRVRDDWSGGSETVPMSSDFMEFLKASSPLPQAGGSTKVDGNTLSVLIHKGRCEAKAGEVAPVTWNQSMPYSPQTYVLRLNSFSASEVYLIVGRNKMRIECFKLDASDEMAFDYDCRIPGDMLGTEPFVKIEINRLRNGQIDRPVVLRVAR